MNHGMNPLFLADLLLLSISGVVARAVMLMLTTAVAFGPVGYLVTVAVITLSGVQLMRLAFDD